MMQDTKKPTTFRCGEWLIILKPCSSNSINRNSSNILLIMTSKNKNTGKTKIRHREDGKDCARIVGYDANALYLGSGETRHGL